ncbi:MAG: hypothetical protein JW874_14870 [Spirochaetales bacterium]|nr:hypothetical protein [Spirochaetales bacterium]
MDKTMISISGRISRLIKTDGKNIFRDPLIALVFSAPVLLLVVVCVIFPFIGRLLYNEFSFDLSPYYPPIVIFMGSVSSLLCGMVAGLMLLDDRDEKILMQISVTPFGLLRYFVYRTVFLALVCLVFSFVYFLVQPLVAVSITQNIIISLYNAAECIILALFLSLFAANKVQGMSLAKLTGLTLTGPITAFFIPAPYHLFTLFLPTYWNAMVVYSRGPAVILYASGGLLYHGILVFLLARKTRSAFL